MSANKLKIFVPDWTDQYEKPYCTPFFYPFLDTSDEDEKLVSVYGDWFKDVTITKSIRDADLVVLLYELLYYYKKNKIDELVEMNKLASSEGKVTVCWVKGDFGITPNLQNYHLYRVGGYKSKNKGNQFCIPVFIPDPLYKYYNGRLPVIYTKTEKPIVGFCGQGRAGLLKATIELGWGLRNRILKVAGKWKEDLEQLKSTTYKRSLILDALQSSSKVTTNFVRHKKYRAGLTTKEEKEKSSQAYFQNMKESQYIVCYRGAGNFSVRLFETLASGRVPVIVCSDNNLPFEDKINWNQFPIVPENDWKRTAAIVAAFHNKLTDAEFVELQQKARKIWEEYLSNKGFFKHMVEKYKSASPVLVPA
jgi:hypothetical protein